MGDPIAQFMQWLAEEAECKGVADPTAMSLATVSEDGYPNCRIVLFKGLVQRKGDKALSFYTNYNSPKGRELDATHKAALTWYWPETYRQVRMTGDVSRMSDEESDMYFDSRPVASRAGAIVSPQSEVISEYASLQEALSSVLESGLVPRPPHWGGYCFLPHSIEFWEGKDHRLHERLLCRKKEGYWVSELLAP